MKLRKLRKAYRIFFPRKSTLASRYEEQLKRNREIESYAKSNGVSEVQTIGGNKLFVRDENSSDLLVFEQIFNFQEYAVIKQLIGLNGYAKEKIIIVDAGANVGYTSVYFLDAFKNAQVFAIEPSAENAAMIAKNTAGFTTNATVKLLNMALSHKRNMTYSIDRDFRDGKDWSITTTPDPSGLIQGISVSEIIEQNALPYITLLKIDIEGAERFIFGADADLSFLKSTKILAVEIHDEFHIRETIYKILLDNDFLLTESGELTIAINKRFV